MIDDHLSLAYRFWPCLKGVRWLTSAECALRSKLIVCLFATQLFAQACNHGDVTADPPGSPVTLTSPRDGAYTVGIQGSSTEIQIYLTEDVLSSVIIHDTIRNGGDYDVEVRMRYPSQIVDYVMVGRHVYILDTAGAIREHEFYSKARVDSIFAP